MADATDLSQPMILLVVGGDRASSSPSAVPRSLPSGSIVVAADSGLDRLPGGLAADHVVGDLDSVSDGALAEARAHGTHVHRHHADKDATDIELALDLIGTTIAAQSGLRTLLIVGGGGGRLDHLLADLLVITAPALAGFDVTARFATATVTVVRPGRERTVSGSPHEQVSLLPFHGPAGGVTTQRLRWPLVDAYLAAGTTRAMSNEFVDSEASVRIDSGVLAVVQPGTKAPPISPRPTPYDPSPRPPKGTLT